MKILVTGASGQLGAECVRQLKNKEQHEILGVSSKDFDICCKNDLQQCFGNFAPDIVIHCAAFTNVDKAELDPERCFEINYDATKNIVDLCKQKNAKLVFISSDFVYDGVRDDWISENQTKHPLNVYGKSKAAAEDYITANLTSYYILRTSWLYGIGGNNFISSIIRVARKQPEYMEIVSDQVGSPTSCVDLSKLICELIFTDKYGVYNATNSGFASKYELARTVFEILGIDTEIRPITTTEYNLKHDIKTLRPMYSKLNNDKLESAGFHKLSFWQDSIRDYLNILKINGN